MQSNSGTYSYSQQIQPKVPMTKTIQDLNTIFHKESFFKSLLQIQESQRQNLKRDLEKREKTIGELSKEEGEKARKIEEFTLQEK